MYWQTDDKQMKNEQTRQTDDKQKSTVIYKQKINKFTENSSSPKISAILLDKIVK